MRQTTGLLSPFVGSKADVIKYPVHDGGEYDGLVEPFGGAGHFTTRHLYHCGQAIVSDKDPAVWTVWHCWLDPELRLQVDARLIEWRGKVLEDVEQAYAELREAFDSLVKTPGFDRVELAAVSITIRKLLFGANCRPNATTGKLNVALSKDKVTSFRRRERKHQIPQLQLFSREQVEMWIHHWRPMPSGTHITLFPHWRLACLALEQSSIRNAIALVDPMYWLPYSPGTKRRGVGPMSPAYPGHDPSSDENFWDCVDCTEWLLASGKVRRLVVTNYISESIKDAMATLARRYSFEMWFSNLGPLNTMNKTQAPKTENEEGAWEFGGRRMFRDKSVPTQVCQLVFL